MVLLVQRIFTRDLHKHSCLLVSPLLCTFLITTMSTFSNMLNRGQEYRKNTTVLCENHQQRVFSSSSRQHSSSPTSRRLVYPQSSKAMNQYSLFSFLCIHWLPLHGWVSLHELLTQWMETRNVLRCTTFSNPTGIRL